MNHVYRIMIGATFLGAVLCVFIGLNWFFSLDQMLTVIAGGIVAVAVVALSWWIGDLVRGAFER